MNAWDLKREAAIPMWQARIKACRSSGLSIREWCAANGIDRRTYYRWESLCLARASQNAASETSLQIESRSMIRVNPTQLPSNCFLQAPNTGNCRVKMQNIAIAFYRKMQKIHA